MYVVYFEPLKLDTGRTVTQPGTMYNQIPAKSEQRAWQSIHFPGRSIFLHIQLPSGPAQKQKTPRLAAANLTRTDSSTPAARPLTGGWSTHRDKTFSVERKTGQKENKLGAKKAHTLTSVPTEAMVPGRKLRPPWNYVTFIDARTS